jgi:hypothetical protein
MQIPYSLSLGCCGRVEKRTYVDYEISRLGVFDFAGMLRMSELMRYEVRERVYVI